MAHKTRETVTTSTLARVNQTAIVRALRESGALSRQQIVAQTGLSTATVNRLTATLLDAGVISPAGQEPSTGGRPSVLLRYAGSSRVVAAIEVRSGSAAGMLVDLDGKVVLRRTQPFSHDAVAPDAPSVGTEQEDVAFGSLCALFDDLVATAASMGTPCKAVGVAVPGVVQHPDGVVGTMPELGWTDLPLGKLLRARTALPVVVENDANALAFGELHAGNARGMSSLVALLIEDGLGAGIIANGEVHRGAKAEAGEIGYLITERSSFARAYDEHGDLEDRIGARALTRRAHERGMRVPAGGVVTAADIFRLSRDGDRDAAELADEILDGVAMAAAAMIIVLDPELVVIGSGFPGVVDVVIPAVRERLQGSIIRVPLLAPAAHREEGVLLGTAELAMAEVNGFAYLSV